EFSLVRRSNATPFLEGTDLALVAGTGVNLTFGSTTTRDGITHLTGSFTDGNVNNTYAVVINWGDAETISLPMGPDAIGPGGVRGFAIDHMYPANVDATFTPTVQLLLTATAEGAAVQFAGRFTDPEKADQHTVTIAWGDG